MDANHIYTIIYTIHIHKINVYMYMAWWKCMHRYVITNNIRQFTSAHYEFITMLICTYANNCL